MKYLVWLEHSRTSININLSLPEAHSFLQSQSPGSRAGCRALPRLPLQAEKPTPSPSLVPSPHVTKTFCVPYWPSGNKLLAASAIRAGPFWHFDRQFLPLYIGVFFLFSIIPSCHMFLYFVRFFFLNESFVGFVDSSIFFFCFISVHHFIIFFYFLWGFSALFFSSLKLDSKSFIVSLSLLMFAFKTVCNSQTIAWAAIQTTARVAGLWPSPPLTGSWHPLAQGGIAFLHSLQVRPG